MIDDILQQFLGSPQGNAALQTLQQQQGMSPQAAQQALNAASEGASHAFQQANPDGLPQGAQGIMGGTLGSSAIAGVLSSMLGGGGLGGMIQGGVSGMVVGKIAQMIAARTGMNQQSASLVAAAIAPHLLRYLQAHHGGAQQGMPTMQAPMQSMPFPNAMGGNNPFAVNAPTGAAANMQPMGGPGFAPQSPKGGYDPGISAKEGYSAGKESYDQGKGAYGKEGYDSGKEGYAKEGYASGKEAYAKEGYDPGKNPKDGYAEGKNVKGFPEQPEEPEPFKKI